jgi:hypothetical protein
MKEDEVYFRIFLRGPQYPVIVISGDDIYPAFKSKDLGNTCYSLSPPGSSNKITVVDSTGEEFLYLSDKVTLAPGIGSRKWTKKKFIDLFNNCSIALEEGINYSLKSLSNKRLATIVNEICTMLATTN